MKTNIVKLRRANADDGDLTKLQGDVMVKFAEIGASLADIQERLAKIEAQPLPMGTTSCRAVDKVDDDV